MAGPVSAFGPRAILVAAAGRRPAALGDALRVEDGVVDVVVGADSVLVVADRPGVLDRVAARAAGITDEGAAHGPQPLVEIPVVYDGPDLEDVATRAELSPQDVVKLHSGAAYEVAFVGFAPGFGYLRGLPDALRLPRRAEPRSRVPAGAVAIADRYSAVYPTATPGGWHLLGRTEEVLFDPGRQPPALLAPGTRVRFIPVEGDHSRPKAGGADPPDAPGDPVPAGTASVEVLEPGALTTVQDAGRPGHAAEGVPPSGPADRGAARLANRLVGNEEGAAVLETTLAGPSLLLGGDQARTFVVTGPPGPVTAGGVAQGANAPFDVRPGQVVKVGAPLVGLRRYVAVSGGWVPAPILGSRSTDLLTGLGPPPLRAGHRLPLGVDRGGRPGVEIAPVPVRPASVELRTTPGPHHDWLSAEGAAGLGAAAWEVASSSNRIAVRLDGPHLDRARTGEVPSLGLVGGAVQLTPSGQLMVFGPDHPVTGGYPIVAVVHGADLDLLAQLRPGERVRLRPAA